MTVEGLGVPHLAEWRRWLGMSQVELATVAGTSVDAVIGLERGKHGVHPSTLGKLAAAFGVPRYVLLHSSPSDAWASGWRPANLEGSVAVGGGV
jgi:transcriptional regulator with XRE-family HTH domain